MKKVMKNAVVLIMVVSIFIQCSIQGMAMESGDNSNLEKTIVQMEETDSNSEIIPCKVTYAKSDVDLSDEISENLKGKIDTTINGVSVDNVVDIDTQLHASYTLSSGDEKQIYKVEATSTFETEIDDSGNLTVEPTATVSEYTLSEYSENYTDLLQLKTTIYYETGVYNTVGYIKLTKVKTDVSYIGGSVKSNLLKVRYGYYGYNLNTGLLMSSQYTSSWTTAEQTLTLTKSVTCPRLELTPGGIPYNIFGEAVCEASRGNYTFTVSHIVREIDASTPSL